MLQPLASQIISEIIPLMSFFEGLSHRMGSQGYNSFMISLFKYLKGYGYFLQWTCKDLAKRPLTAKYLLLNNMVYEGDVKMIQYLTDLDYEDTFMYSNVTPGNVQMVKWMERNGVADTSLIFRNAISSNNYEVVNYCIKKGYKVSQGYWSANGNLKMFKHLWKNKVVDDTSIWTSGGFYSITEDVLLFVMRHQHEIVFNYAKFASEASFTTMLNMLRHHAYERSVMKLRGTINFICEEVLANEDNLLPLEICENLPYLYAIQFDSDCCECNNPNNHEDRVRNKVLKV